MKAVVIVLLLMLGSGCVSVVKLESGERALGDRMFVTLDGPWNRLNAPGLGPAQTWTMEGLPIDQLLLYTGLKSGEAIHATAAGGTQKPFVYQAGMRPDQIVTLFDGMLSRGGSVFKLGRLEPARFAGVSEGFRFEFTLIRRIDNVELRGLGYGTIDKGDLFALVYMAPATTFFARHQARVEAIAKSARLKN